MLPVPLVEYGDIGFDHPPILKGIQNSKHTQYIQECRPQGPLLQT